MTAMETELTPAEVIAQADSEIQEAEQLATELENRVREGDESVGYEQVERARGLMGFARLRREAAEKKAARLEAQAASAARQAVIDTHLPALKAFDAAKVEKLRAEAERKLVEAASLINARNAHIAALAELADGEGNPFHPEDDAEITGSTRLVTLFVKVEGERFDAMGGSVPARKCLTAVEALDRQIEFSQIRQMTGYPAHRRNAS